MPLPRSKKTRALLAYLVVTGREQRRDRLCSLLWEIPDDPRGALRWSLSKLRPLVDAPDRRRILADRERVRFDPAGVEIDLLALRALVEEGLDQASTERLRAVASGLGEGFLAGLDLHDLLDYQAWLTAERAEAQALEMALLEELVTRLADDPGEALVFARLATTIDPDDAKARAAVERLQEEGRQHRMTVPTVPDPPQEQADEPQGAFEGERKQVTALYVGVEGAARLLESLDPEAALSAIDPAIDRIAQAIARFGGVVAARDSEGLLALFGAPFAQEDHRERACHAALAVRHDAEDPSASALSITMGLCSGEAVVRPTGEKGARHYEAVGPAVQLAKQLQATGAAGTIAMTADRGRGGAGIFQTRPAGTLQLGGQRLAVAQLVALAPTARPWQARLLRSATRFVGRDAELAALAAAMQRVGPGRGAVVAAVGEPGMGKSRLVQEFLRTPEARDWTLLETGGASHDSDAAYRPVANLLRSWCGVDVQDSQPTATAKVRTHMLALDSGLEPLLPALLSVLNLPTSDAAWEVLGATQRRALMLDALKTMLVRESRRKPLILVMEDLHWFDRESLAFLDSLVEGLGAAPLLLLVTYRPEFRHGWNAKSYYAEVRLHPLPDLSARLLLDSLLGEDPDQIDLKHLLLERTAGTPLFLEESVRALAETGALTGLPGAYRQAGPIDGLAIPASIQSLLAARIDHLPAAAKALLQVAAVIGATVPLRLLKPVSRLADDLLTESLATLRAAEFLFEAQSFPRPEYVFKHAILRDVAYQSLLRGDRKELHRRVGLALEELHGERLAEAVEIIAAHFQAGEDHARAAAYFLKASERAKQQNSYSHAAGLARQALAATEAAGAEEAAVRPLVLLGELESLLGDLEQANDFFDSALTKEKDAKGRRNIENKRHRRGFRDCDGVKLAYYEHGTGEETLVFVHPFVYGLSVFQPVVERLCQDFRVITIDGRGTGASDPLPRAHTLDDHIANYISVLRHVKRGRKMTAVGMSRGVNLLVKLSIKAPDLLDRIVLVGGDTRQTLGFGLSPTDCPMMKESHVRTFLEALSAGEVLKAIRLFSPAIYSEPGTRDLRVQFEQEVLKLDPYTVVSFFTYDKAVEIDGLLDQVRTPTLVMHGTQDRDTPFERGLALAKAIAGARFYAFEDKGHLPTFTATTEFCDQLVAFVRGKRVGRAAQDWEAAAS